MGRSKSVRRRVAPAVVPDVGGNADGASSASVPSDGDVEMAPGVDTVAATPTGLGDTTIVSISDGGTISSESLDAPEDGIDLEPGDSSLVDELEADPEPVPEPNVGGDGDGDGNADASGASSSDVVAGVPVVPNDSDSSGIDVTAGDVSGDVSQSTVGSDDLSENLYEAVSLICEAGRSVTGTGVGDGFVVDASVVSICVYIDSDSDSCFRFSPDSKVLVLCSIWMMWPKAW